MLSGVEVKFVDALIAKIAHETKVGQQVVWQAFIRGMYEGEEFNDPELRNSLAEVIAPDFLDKLAKANYPHELNKLMNTLALPQEGTTTHKFLSWLNRILTRKPRLK